MKLYYFPGACPLATHIALEWIGKPYEAVRLTREQTKEPEYLKLNPTGMVPTLVDGDLVLTQNDAIMEYVAELNPEADLVGKTPRERAETRRWFGMCNSDLHRTFGLIFAADYFSDGDASAAKVLTRKAAEKLKALFKIVDADLKGRNWLTGKRSIADPYLFVLLTWAEAKQLDMSTFPELRRFLALMRKDAGVQRALKAQGLA